MQVVSKKTEELHPWSGNPRRNDHAVDAVAKSISTFGFNVPILCDRKMTIVAGHTRWKAAKKLGLAEVPVVIVDLDDDQRVAFALADNRTAEIADWDTPKLRSCLELLENHQVEIRDLGFDAADLRRILSSDDEDVVSSPGSLARTKIGDLCGLRQHRLICGDAGDSHLYKRLIGNRQLDLVVTSPPRFNNKGMGHWPDIESHLADIRKVVENSHHFLKPGGVVFWNVGSCSSSHLNLPCLHARLLAECGFEYLDTLAWIRSGANYSIRRNAHIVKNRFYYPAHQWEPIFVYRKPGPMPRMTAAGCQYMRSFQSDVWEIAAVTNPLVSNHHPAVGPVEVPYRALMAYSPESALVLDPFAGSGTTLIAAEQTDRQAFAIEIDPVYCDVIVDRWEQFTGDQARLLDSDKKGGQP